MMKNFKSILPYLRIYRGKIFLYFLTSMLAILFSIFTFGMIAPVLQILFVGEQMVTGSNQLVARLTETVNEMILSTDKMQALTYVVMIVVLFTLLKNLFIYLSLCILNPLRNDVMRRLRNQIFSKTVELPIGFFTEERKGDLISRMTNDVTEVEVSIMSVLETVIREPLTILFTLASMLILSVELTMFLLLFLPLAGYVIGRIGKSLRKPSNAAQVLLGTMLGVIDETLGGMRIIKAFNAEKHQFARFFSLNSEYFRTRNRIGYRRDLGSPLSETLGILVVSIIIWYGGRLIFSGQTSLTGPTFILYVGLFYQIINPIKNLSSAFYNVQKGKAALDRIEQLMSVENTIKEAEKPQPLPGFEREITFRKVDFYYGKKKVLHEIDLVIPKGRTVALVGSSGSGKSTIADLIPRFHEVTSGGIYLDGVNIKEFRLAELRSLMGMVSQEPILFHDTIYNNIVLGTGGARREQVEEAARIAHAHSFIMKKPQGYDTMVGDRGTRLSGGERQRITIARAVLKNPPILILDEATSSLDTESERQVQDALEGLMKDRTTLVIAHRLSTVQHADEILVLDQGRIVERGDHESLMQLNGLYTNLVDLQKLN